MSRRKSDFHPIEWDQLDPGEERLPERRRYSQGDMAWLIGDPPERVEVELDTGHPRWLRIRQSGSGGGVRWLTSRLCLRRTAKRAARAQLIQYRRQLTRLQVKMSSLRLAYGLP